MDTTHLRCRLWVGGAAGGTAKGPRREGPLEAKENNQHITSALSQSGRTHARIECGTVEAIVDCKMDFVLLTTEADRYPGPLRVRSASFCNGGEFTGATTKVAVLFYFEFVGFGSAWQWSAC